MSFRILPIPELLEEIRVGRAASFDIVVAELYRELRAIASGQRRRLRASDTLHTTALVHEAYLKLHGGQQPRSFVDRGHFFRVAARVMHDVLVDYSRACLAQKRGGGTQHLTIGEVSGGIPAAGQDLATIISVDDAMQRLRVVDQEAAQVVELRYFGGLTNAEAAEAMSTSVSTVKRRWLSARAYLAHTLAEPDAWAHAIA